METKEHTSRNTHHGHAVKRFRHTLGKKQEALASEMGLSQALISTYEQRKVLSDDVIERFAKALNVAPELIKELEEDPVTFIIENNTFENGSVCLSGSLMVVKISFYQISIKTVRIDKIFPEKFDFFLYCFILI